MFKEFTMPDQLDNTSENDLDTLPNGEGVLTLEISNSPVRSSSLEPGALLNPEYTSKRIVNISVNPEGSLTEDDIEETRTLLEEITSGQHSKARPDHVDLNVMAQELPGVIKALDSVEVAFRGTPAEGSDEHKKLIKVTDHLSDVADQLNRQLEKEGEGGEPRSLFSKGEQKVAALAGGALLTTVPAHVLPVEHAVPGNIDYWMNVQNQVQGKNQPGTTASFPLDIAQAAYSMRPEAAENDPLAHALEIKTLLPGQIKDSSTQNFASALEDSMRRQFGKDAEVSIVGLDASGAVIGKVTKGNEEIAVVSTESGYQGFSIPKGKDVQIVRISVNGKMETVLGLFDGGKMVGILSNPKDGSARILTENDIQGNLDGREYKVVDTVKGGLGGFVQISPDVIKINDGEGTKNVARTAAPEAGKSPEKDQVVNPIVVDQIKITGSKTVTSAADLEKFRDKNSDVYKEITSDKDYQDLLARGDKFIKDYTTKNADKPGYKYEDFGSFVIPQIGVNGEVVVGTVVFQLDENKVPYAFYLLPEQGSGNPIRKIILPDSMKSYFFVSLAMDMKENKEVAALFDGQGNYSIFDIPADGTPPTETPQPNEPQVGLAKVASYEATPDGSIAKRGQDEVIPSDNTEASNINRWETVTEGDKELMVNKDAGVKFLLDKNWIKPADLTPKIEVQHKDLVDKYIEYTKALATQNDPRYAGMTPEQIITAANKAKQDGKSFEFSLIATDMTKNIASPDSITTVQVDFNKVQYEVFLTRTDMNIGKGRLNTLKYVTGSTGDEGMVGIFVSPSESDKVFIVVRLPGKDSDLKINNKDFNAFMIMNAYAFPFLYMGLPTQVQMDILNGKISNLSVIPEMDLSKGRANKFYHPYAEILFQIKTRTYGFISTDSTK